MDSKIIIITSSEKDDKNMTVLGVFYQRLMMARPKLGQHIGIWNTLHLRPRKKVWCVILVNNACYFDKLTEFLSMVWFENGFEEIS